MIIWRGWGAALIAIAVVSAIAVQQAGELITGVSWDDITSEQYYNACFYGLMAVLTYALHLYLQRREPVILVDPKTGAQYNLKGGDSFFFIPIRFWPIIFLALSGWMALK